MASVIEIWADGDSGFIKGKKTTRHGEPTGIKPLPVVTLVSCQKIDAFLGARSYAERLAHLRDLRDREPPVLICDSGPRLTQSLARGSQGVKRAYAFACREREVPRIDRSESRAEAKPVGSSSGGVRKVLEV